MKHSIRFKLFIVITGIIVSYVLISWLFNNLLLDKYYYYNKKNTLIRSFNAIDVIYKGNPEDIALELEKLERNEGLHIIIQGSDLNVKYNSVARRVDMFFKAPNRNNFQENNPIIRSRADLLLKIRSMLENRRDERVNANFIEYFSVLNNGDFIVLSTPAAAIKESAVIANKFFMYTGFFMILVGIAAVYFISGRFTNPILELNEISKRMSVLDFSKKYYSKNDDEFGQLGESINSMSEQLEKSICELQNANSKLREDIKKERQIDEMRKYIISSVSHELKTPISLIQGYAEGLKLNINDDEENKNFYCDVIMDEAFKMNKIVKQLLELSKLESGQIHLDKVDFDIALLISNVIKKNNLVYNDMNIKVILNDLKEYTVSADMDKTEQVLMNYLNNAIDHVDEHKTIEVRTRLIDDKVRVSIFNTGSHIPFESLDKIWNSFYKVDKARTRAHGGTGLGLSIVKAIQDEHGNKCGVANVKGGVEFWFDINLSKVQK